MTEEEDDDDDDDDDHIGPLSLWNKAWGLKNGEHLSCSL